MSSAARLLRFRLVVFAILALIARWPALSMAGHMNDFRDAHVLYQYEESARASVVGYHQAPLWNPYYCGGVYELGSPQARFVSPSFVLTLLFGTLRADALIGFFMLIVGLEGTYRYLRDRKAASWAALLAAPIFALSGLFAHAPSLGWTHFYGFELVPWVAFGLRRALAGKSWGAAIAGGAVLWMIGFGGTYAAPLTFLFCGFELIEALIKQRSPRVLGMAALTALLAVGLSAIRLWPIVETLAAAPRILGGAPANDVASIGKMLFGPRYMVGIVAAPVAIFALVRRRAIPLVIACLLLSWLAMGYGAKISVFARLRDLPLYEMLRFPERFLTLMALPLAALAALGVTSLAIAARRHRPLRYVRWACLAALVVNAGLLVKNMYAWHVDWVAPPAAEARDFRQARGNRWVLAHYGPMARGSLSCFDDYQVPMSPLLRSDLPAEEYSHEGTVTRRVWSPNRIELDVDLPQGGRVFVNQNWHPGWRASTGEVKSDRGLLAVDVPAGKRTVVLSFLPRSAIGGACVSIAAAVVAIALALRPRRLVTSLLLAGAPLLIGVVVFLGAKEPRVPPRALELPDGSPLVTPAPPDGARDLDVLFAGGITLAYARANAAAGAMDLELGWRVGEKVPRGLGVFVHVESPSGKVINVDHVMLSQAITFDEAPREKLLRDVLHVELSERGAHKVYVGLWMARRSGQRVKVIENSSAVVEDARVLAVTAAAP